jgi:hypothetical protein
LSGYREQSVINNNFIQVYGRQDNEENPHFRRSTTGGRYTYNAMISVMTNDWTDEAKTMDVAKKIRAAGVKAVLRYKPDISTTLEIYRKVYQQ